MKKRIYKQDIFKYLTVPISLAMLWFYIYYTEGWDRVSEVFKNLDYRFVVLMMIEPLLSTALTAVSIAYMRRPYQRGVPFLYTLHTSWIASFWGGITPSSTQIGFIAQVTAERKQGLSVGNSTAIHFANAIPQNVALLIKKIVMFFIAFDYLKKKLSFVFLIFFIADCCMSVVNMCIYFFVPRFDKAISSIVCFVINIFGKIHIIKNTNEKIEKAKCEILLLKNNMKNLKYSVKDWIVATLICMVVQSIGLFSLYLSTHALHITLLYPYWLTVAIQTVGGGIMSFLSIIPIPGNFGIQETINYIISKPLVGVENINFSIILGRLTGYYFPLLVYAIAVAIPVSSGKHRLNMERNDEL